MATKFLLPCECGQTIAIEVGQAGQKIPCACGKTVEAPSMRAIRSLELQPEQPDAPKPKRSWSPAAGMVFVTGSILILIALTTIGFAYFSRSLLHRNLPVRSPENVAQWLGEIDQTPADGLIDVWNETVEKGFSEADESPWQLYRAEAGKYKLTIWIGLALAALGLAMSTGATLLRSPDK